MHAASFVYISIFFDKMLKVSESDAPFEAYEHLRVEEPHVLVLACNAFWYSPLSSI